MTHEKIKKKGKSTEKDSTSQSDGGKKKIYMLKTILEGLSMMLPFCPYIVFLLFVGINGVTISITLL